MKKEARITQMFQETQVALGGHLILEVWSAPYKAVDPQLEFRIRRQSEVEGETISLKEPDAGMLLDMLGRALSSVNQPGPYDRAAMSKRIAAKYRGEASVDDTNNLVEQIADYAAGELEKAGFEVPRDMTDQTIPYMKSITKRVAARYLKID
jgi:hypothetical protein